jgi:hypothetical protein
MNKNGLESGLENRLGERLEKEAQLRYETHHR